MSNGNKNKINPVLYGLILVIAVVGALIFGGNGGDDTSAPDITTTQNITSHVTASQTASAETSAVSDDVQQSISESAAAEQNAVQYYFRSQSTLDSHYEKHGIEMGFVSAEEYEAAASDVVNSPDALYKTEKEDGDHVYYIESTNEFVVVSTDGYIRTYFLPSAGKDYFDRQ